MMRRTAASIPVELENPGQVLACVGFLEAAELLMGNCEAHFDWSGTKTQFVLVADGDTNPFEVVLDFLEVAEVVELTPIGYVEGGAADGADDDAEDARHAKPGGPEDERSGALDDTPSAPSFNSGRVTAAAFPSGEGNRSTLPIRLVQAEGRHLTLSHWADGSSRNPFKLFAGQASARGVLKKLLGPEETGFRAAWKQRREALLAAPFGHCQPIKGGTFYFDARRAWTGIDAGFSPDEQAMPVHSSPVVEVLAAVGLEHARPDEYATRKVRYAVWGHPMPVMLARAALSGADLKAPMRRFEFELDLSGKNKVTTFAQEETQA